MDEDDALDLLACARQAMIAAFVHLSDLALKAGVDQEQVGYLHEEFFDANVSAKLAWLQMQVMRKSPSS